MDSPGHRANILSGFTHIGVGVHYDRANGRLYAAQVFYRLVTPAIRTTSKRPATN